MSFEQSFDYIVIGAGSSGCVVANRLSSKRDTTVLLLEAGGPDTNPAIHEPSGLLSLWGSDIDWKYLTEEQPHLHGRKLMISRGKVLGGCSSIYAMIYVRGNPKDFDTWNFLGNEGWSYTDVLPYFKKSEDYDGGGDAYHSVGGELSVRSDPSPTPVAFAFAKAAAELGYGGPDWDFNGAQQENGGGLYQFNITPDGKRCSTAVAFLNPILDRLNLTVTPWSQVTKILVDSGRAVGVEYVQDGQIHQVKANREVILSAGAFDSPRLLMLSGIGPAEQLRSHGIAVVSDLPGVGQNLQDHVLLPIVYKSKQVLPEPTFIAEAGLFVTTRPGLEAASPDLQFHFSAGISKITLPDYPVEGSTFVFVPILAKPQSRGTITLRSANPVDPPVINPHYLECDTDLEVFMSAIELSRHLAQTSAFSAFNDGEVAPGLSKTEAELKEYIRTHCSTVWHPVGTCKMGRDALAVVDPQLRVYGVDGLRVADASIMPIITSGNTNAACVMIGEKVADMILQS